MVIFELGNKAADAPAVNEDRPEAFEDACEELRAAADEVEAPKPRDDNELAPTIVAAVAELVSKSVESELKLDAVEANESVEDEAVGLLMPVGGSVDFLQ